MSSDRQIEANRRNARKSRGPTSAEGKAKVAGNALKHGLAGNGVIMPGEMTQQIYERMTFLRPSYLPDGPAQEWLFSRLCIETVRADLCVHQVIALRDEAATQAGESWDDDRALDAEELGAGIGRRPELVQPRLLRSRHGALWLVAQWEELGRQLDLRGEWIEAAKGRALDLLGVPTDARLGVWEGLVGGSSDGRDLIRDELDALRRRIDEYLDDRDDRARSDAMVGLAADGPDLRRVLRYESAALNRLRSWTRELRRLQNPADAPAERRPRSDAGAPAPPARPARTAPPPNEPEPVSDAPRAAASIPPGNSSMAATVRGTVAPSGPTVSANRHARRAQAALERRSRRS